MITLGQVQITFPRQAKRHSGVAQYAPVDDTGHVAVLGGNAVPEGRPPAVQVSDGSAANRLAGH